MLLFIQGHLFYSVGINNFNVMLKLNFKEKAYNMIYF